MHLVIKPCKPNTLYKSNNTQEHLMKMDDLKSQIKKQKEFYLKILLSQSNEPDERRRLMRQKQGIFKSVIKDIAHKYENINKKLLISLKKGFVDVSNTHDFVLALHKKGKLETNSINKRKECRMSHDSAVSRRSYYSFSTNKRYSSSNLTPKFEYGVSKPPNTAYTSSTGKRQTYYSNSEESCKIDKGDSEMTHKDMKYKMRKNANNNLTKTSIEHRSMTLEAGFRQKYLDHPSMYKSKSRLQVSSLI